MCKYMDISLSVNLVCARVCVSGRLVLPRARCLSACVNVFPAPKAMASSRHPTEARTSLSTSQSKCVRVCVRKLSFAFFFFKCVYVSPESSTDTVTETLDDLLYSEICCECTKFVFENTCVLKTEPYSVTQRESLCVVFQIQSNFSN